MRILGVAAFAAGLALAGCAGRSPQPVATVQPTDRLMDCTAIMAEVESNNQKVQQLASDQGMKTAQNVAAGVAGFVIPVLWFGMDFQGTADKETSALQSRQQYLAMMAEQKRCYEPPVAVTPAPGVRPAKRQPRPVRPPVASVPTPAAYTPPPTPAAPFNTPCVADQNQPDSCSSKS